MYSVSCLSHYPVVPLWPSAARRIASLAHYFLGCACMYVCMYVCSLSGQWQWEMVSRSIVVHWDGAWSASHRIAGSRLALHYLSQRHVSALYPNIHFSTLTYPALLSSTYLCVCCVSLLCVSDLTYLSPFVSLSLCYCSTEGRPSILQPLMAGLRSVRSFCSRERTSPPGTM